MALITIIGAGMMGSALSVPACDAGHRVHLVGTPLDREIIEHFKQTGRHLKMDRPLGAQVKAYQVEEMDEALKGADAVICGVSSFGVEWFGAQALPRIPTGVPVLCVTKGLLEEPGGILLPFARGYERILQGRDVPLCAIGGPCTSYELADRHHSCVVFCGEDMKALRYLKGLLETDYYHISLSRDVMGVECAVGLKNAYALAVSLAVGRAQADEARGYPHYNAQAALFSQGVREMRGLLELFGGGAENIVYGAGDLYVTIFGGRTRRLGTLLGQGMPYTQAMEALDGVTLESVVIASRVASAVRARAAKGEADAAQYPLLLHIDQVINQGAAVDIPWTQFETED